MEKNHVTTTEFDFIKIARNFGLIIFSGKVPVKNNFIVPKIIDG